MRHRAGKELPCCALVAPRVDEVAVGCDLCCFHCSGILITDPAHTQVEFFTCHLPEQVPALGIFLTANGVVEEINVYTARWIYHWSKSEDAGEKNRSGSYLQAWHFERSFFPKYLSQGISQEAQHTQPRLVP